MTKLSTLIVDDEPLALKLLRKKLEKSTEIEIVGECKNGREALEQIINLTPDLVFLDIQMPGINGLEVVKKLQNDFVPLIIFTTAFEQYAIEAFDVHAVDYILKPIDDERIRLAVSRAIERFDLGEISSSKSNIIGAIEDIDEKEANNSLNNENETDNISTRDNYLEQKIAIKDRDDITLLKQANIEWVDAAGDYVCIHAAGITHIKRSTLTKLLEDLDSSVFKRVHRSTIVNLNHIKKVVPHTKGEYFLKMGEFDQVKVSRNYREVIKSYLANS